MWGKDQQFHFIFVLDIYENTFQFFFRLLLFKGIRFKFCLVAILICYLYFIIYRRAHNVFGTL